MHMAVGMQWKIKWETQTNTYKTRRGAIGALHWDYTKLKLALLMEETERRRRETMKNKMSDIM